MARTALDILTQWHNGPWQAKPAILDGSRMVTYLELLAAARQCGQRLRDLGLQKGDRVGIYLRRSIEAVAAFFGAYLAEGVPVFINEVLRTPQVNHILAHSGASALITDERQLLMLPDPAIRADRIINLDTDSTPVWHGSPVSLIGEDLALIIYTSGSTGLPKGVMVSHANLVAGAEVIAEYLQMSDQDVVISLLPFSFDYGLNQVLSTLFVGGTLVIQRSTAPPDICRTLNRYAVTGMAGVPMLWRQLCDSYSPFLSMHCPTLRYVTNSGGTLSQRLVSAMRKAHPHVHIYLMYGLTEAFRSTYLPPDELDRRPTSIGKAIPGTEIMIINEQGELCGPGEIGELVHHGPTVSMGYWRDPEATDKVFRKHPMRPVGETGFQRVVYSGDLVKRDGDGYLYFVGRRDHLIKSHGFRVSPDEIERSVQTSGLIRDAVAFAVPLPEGEARIVLVVIPNNEETFEAETLHQFCKAQMPTYMRPSVISVAQEFPQTPSGKPDRVALKEAYVNACCH